MTIQRVAARRVTRAALAGAVIATLGGGGGGCNLFNREEARPLTADAFVSQRVEGRVDPEPIDRPGQVIVQAVRTPGDNARGGATTRNPRPATRPAQAPRVNPVPVGPVDQGGAPTTARAGDPSGQYVIF